MDSFELSMHKMLIVHTTEEMNVALARTNQSQQREGLGWGERGVKTSSFNQTYFLDSPIFKTINQCIPTIFR